MKKALIVGLSIAVLFVSVPAVAEYPDDCLGLGEPSASTCQDVSYQGCCDDAGRLVFCDGDALYCLECSELSGQCGWKPDAGFYDCGTEDGGEDETGENPKLCPHSCSPSCEAGLKCEDGECVPCVAQCDGKVCGSDGCGGSCGECEGTTFCSGGKCEIQDGCLSWQQAGCGGCKCEACVCAADPYCCNVSWDATCIDECKTDCEGCGALENCGDEICQGAEGENCEACPADCPCGDGTICWQYDCCTATCDGKQCGDDGCGGDCGGCEGGLFCIDHLCAEQDGCAEVDEPGCGECACEACVCDIDPYCCGVAWDAKCVAQCQGECGGCGQVEDCGNGVCNDQGLENCGNCPADCTCPEGEGCFAGKCCASACDGVECGNDGCGRSCGDCPDGSYCGDGECIAEKCEPDCESKVCGNDGCDGSCGVCGDGTVCQGGVCVPDETCQNDCQQGEKGCDGPDRWVCAVDSTGCYTRETHECGDAGCTDGACQGDVPDGDVLESADLSPQPDAGVSAPDAGDGDGGGDGCNTGGTSNAAALLMLLLLLGLGVIPRLRRHSL